MPIDPAHGRRYPSGKRLAALLERIFRAMRAAVIAALRSGRSTPDLGRYTQVIAQHVTPILSHEWALGAEQIRRELRRAKPARRQSKTVKAIGSAGLRPVSPGLDLAWGVFRPETAAAIQSAALQLAGSLTANITQQVRQILREGLEVGESVAAIASNLGTIFTPARALTVGMTESSRAMHAGEMAAIRGSGVTDKWEWLASSDACEKCMAINGKVVKVGEPFVIDEHGGPYAVITHPPRHPHCMCAIKPAVRLGGR